MVLAYRPPEFQRLQLPRVERLPHFTQVSLAELNSAEAEQAIRARLAQLFPERSEAVPAALIEQVTARAQGNPFYLEELLNYLHDRGLDPWGLGNPQALDLPASLQSLILSRIDQLSTRQQLTLKVASIIGRMFRFDHLQGYYPTLGRPEEIKGDLELLSQLDLTPLEAPEPELAYLFKHIVTREVAYESLAYTTRAALHEQFACYLETTQAAQQGEALLDLLAYHYDQSDNLPKRREYLRQAGAAAAARYANVEAVDYLSRALALAGEAETRFELLLRRVEIYDRQGNREAQGQDVDTLSDLAGQLDRAERQAEAALQRAIYAHRLSDYPGCLNAAAQAVALGQAADHFAVMGSAYLQGARALLEQGDYDAAHRQTQLSLTLARQSGDRNAESRALHTLGVIASYQGDHAAAQAYFEQTLHVAHEMADRWLESKALNSLGIIVYEQGGYEAARDYFEHSLQLAREMGDRDGESRRLNNLGSLAGEQGDNLAAWAYFEQALRLSREMGDRQGEGIGVGNLGTIAARQGDYVAAGAYYEQSLDLNRAIGYREGEALALWGLGNVGLGLGHLAEAADFYRQSLRLRRELGHPALVVEAIAGLARLALAQADLVEAQAQVEEILSYLAGNGTLDGAEEPLRVYLTCYQILQATRDPRAGTILATGYNLLQARAAKIADEPMRQMFWENIPYHRELAAAWANRP
jgi:tetratricopeptide (TPR) repeat protein